MRAFRIAQELEGEVFEIALVVGGVMELRALLQRVHVQENNPYITVSLRDILRYKPPQAEQYTVSQVNTYIV